MLEAEHILKLLPHKYPMLLVDRITRIEGGRSGVGIKNITVNETYFGGCLCAAPKMPPMAVLECMAQTAGLVCSYGAKPSDDLNHRSLFLVRMEKVEFRREVIAGEQLIVNIKLLKKFGHLIKVFAQVEVQNDVVASGTLTLAGK